jgi:hypothetical protein
MSTLGKRVCGLLLLTLCACSPPLQGELREGLLLAYGGQFVTTEGEVFHVNTSGPADAAMAGIVGPRCLRLDVSINTDRADPWGYDRWTVHRVISDREPDRCHFSTQRYQGYLFQPTEGLYFFTDPASVEDWSNAWAVVDAYGDWTFSSYMTPEIEYQSPRRYCMEVEAVASQVGRFNHLGRSSRQLTVMRVVRTWLPPELPANVLARQAPQGPLVIRESVESCLAPN